MVLIILDHIKHEEKIDHSTAAIDDNEGDMKEIITKKLHQELDMLQRAYDKQKLENEELKQKLETFETTAKGTCVGMQWLNFMAVYQNHSAARVVLLVT